MNVESKIKELKRREKAAAKRLKREQRRAAKRHVANDSAPGGHAH